MKVIFLSFLATLCSIFGVYAQGSVGGSPTMCLGGSTQYTVSGSAATTGYSWTVTPGMGTVTAGNGSKTATVNFTAAGTVYVYVTGNGLTANEAVTVTTPATAPGTIYGNSVMCPGGSATFTSTLGTPYTSATWYVTNGSATVTQQTTSAIVTLPANASLSTFQVNVFKVNGVCGQGPTVSKSVTITNQVPSAPSAITGYAQVCPNDQSVAYSATITNANTYVWSVPAGATIATGQGTGNITVNYSSTVTGNVSVYGTNCNGNGTSSSLAITAKPIPGAASAITGTPLVCSGDQSVSYKVLPAITNASGYNWSLPPGATIATGANTNSITVNYPTPAVAGTVSVYGTSCTGNGSSSTFAVATQAGPGAAGVIDGSTMLCADYNVASYYVDPVNNATGYSWSLPAGATISSGQNTNKISVTYSASATSGNVSVQGTNCNGNNGGTSSTLAVAYATNGIGNVGTGKIDPYVDLVTGTMSASIPLFTVQDGDVSVPGMLTYTATGVRITDDDGWTGHNWDLSVQSYRIARQLRGLPDDFTASGDDRKGWLFGTQRTAIKNFSPGSPATCDAETTNYNFLNGMTYNDDLEPDVFYVSAPGLSFEFYFDENNVPHALPYQDVQINAYTASGIVTSSTTAGPILYFVVTDERGVAYTFSDKESITESVQTPNAYCMVRQSNLFKTSITYSTSWRLSTIKSPVYGTITFTYRPVNDNDNTLYPDSYKKTNQYKYRFEQDFSATGVFGSVTNPVESRIAYQRVSTLQILMQISTPTTEVDFASAPKYPGSVLERLSGITVYDKRSGSNVLQNKITLSYIYPVTDLTTQLPISTGNIDYHSYDYPSAGTLQARAFLRSIIQSAGCQALGYSFEYNNDAASSINFPFYNFASKDAWGFYNVAPYNESVQVGTLTKIIYPYKGYQRFLYEPHDYQTSGGVVQGGGIRLKRTISYDGVSSSGDVIVDYDYKTAAGTSSGKLQYKSMHSFPIVRAEYYGYWGGLGGLSWLEARNIHYGNAASQIGLTAAAVNNLFTLTTDDELSHYNMLHGSVVAYQRVTVKQKGAGQRIYDFDLPASAGDVSANSGEWNASQVSIARPSTGVSGACYALGNIQQGIDQYPFPPSANYEFAKALLQKETDLREDGTTVRDVVYNYQRVYAGTNTAARKIYGLALEEIPTYYNSTDAKMFAFSRYEILTDLKTELSSQTETIYNSTNLSAKTATTVNYYFESTQHKEPTRIETTNSDGITSKKTMTYTWDYSIASPTSASDVGLANMKTQHRLSPVETISTKVIGGTPRTVGASLMLFQQYAGACYPYKTFSFVATDGSTLFTPASANTTSFVYDQTNYVLDKSYSDIDAYGHAASLASRGKANASLAFGYSGTLPVFAVSNAAISEVGYSDFETPLVTDFATSGFPHVYVTGRTGPLSMGLSFPAGSSSTNKLVRSPITNNQSTNYIFSCWIKSGTAGNLSMMFNGTTALGTPLSFGASTDYKYYRFTIPVKSIIGTANSFFIYLWSDTAIQLDDIAFYPEQADITTTTYLLPNGKASQTDSRGNSVFYDTDAWGRTNAVYDKDRNLLQKFNYNLKH